MNYFCLKRVLKRSARGAKSYITVYTNRHEKPLRHNPAWMTPQKAVARVGSSNAETKLHSVCFSLPFGLFCRACPPSICSVHSWKCSPAKVNPNLSFMLRPPRKLKESLVCFYSMGWNVLRLIYSFILLWDRLEAVNNLQKLLPLWLRHRKWSRVFPPGYLYFKLAYHSGEINLCRLALDDRCLSNQI